MNSREFFITVFGTCSEEKEALLKLSSEEYSNILSLVNSDYEYTVKRLCNQTKIVKNILKILSENNIKAPYTFRRYLTNNYNDITNDYVEFYFDNEITLTVVEDYPIISWNYNEYKNGLSLTTEIKIDYDKDIDFIPNVIRELLGKK